MFKEDIEVILSSWHALKFAVQQQTGGPESYAISKWMIEEIEKFFQSNDDLDADEVAETLSNIMDSELNTLVEDGSDLEIAKILCRVYQLNNSGNSNEIQNILSQLPRETQVDCRVHSDSDTEEMETSQDSSQKSNMDVSEGSANTSNTTSTIDSSDRMEDPEGWIMVKKGKGKNR